MQIDLANTLVHKVYSIHNDIIYHCPQARSPLPREGSGVGFRRGRSGYYRGIRLNIIGLSLALFHDCHYLCTVI